MFLFSLWRVAPPLAMGFLDASEGLCLVLRGNTDRGTISLVRTGAVRASKAPPACSLPSGA